MRCDCCERDRPTGENGALPRVCTPCHEAGCTWLDHYNDWLAGVE